MVLVFFSNRCLGLALNLLHTISILRPLSNTDGVQITELHSLNGNDVPAHSLWNSLQCKPPLSLNAAEHAYQFLHRKINRLQKNDKTSLLPMRWNTKLYTKPILLSESNVVVNYSWTFWFIGSLFSICN